MDYKQTTLARWFHKNGYEPIAPLDFYRAIFPSGELAEHTDTPRAISSNSEWKYNGVLLENTHKRKSVLRTNPRNGKKEYTEKEIWKNYIVLDDLERIDYAVNQFGKSNSEFYIAPISYLGRKRTKLRERWIYACIIEVDHPKSEIIDGHREQTGLNQLFHEWTNSSIPYAMPSACVCSGSGLHLIYLLDRPYQISDINQQRKWDNFRKKFTHRIWNKTVTKAKIQYENHCQSFRVVGTRTKKNQLVEAFWLSKKRYSIDELFSQVAYDIPPKWKNLEEAVKVMDEYFAGHYPPDELMKRAKEYMPKIHQSERPLSPKLQEAKEKWPDWYQSRIVEQKPPKQPGQWNCHRGLYDWFLREAKQNPYVGSRYNRIHALAEFAVKCNISYDELKKDAYELYEIFRQVDQNEPFHYAEFIKARDEYFSTLAHKSTRDWIEMHTGVYMNPPAKRNGRKQKDHLTRLNRRRKFEHDEFGDEYGGGRPKGSGSVKDIVLQWRAEHPDGRKIDCIRDTGLGKTSVYKWWDAA
jgi:hypothetical protein